MKHIESSRLITLASPVDVSVIKHVLVGRMRGAFSIETVGEGDENFKLTLSGKGVLYRCTMNVLLKVDTQRARVIVDGTVGVRTATKILYIFGFLALLVLGLFPGILNTSGHGSSAMDILVFLFLGVFILYDVNKKMLEPEILLDRILRALEAEFGV